MKKNQIKLANRGMRFGAFLIDYTLAAFVFYGPLFTFITIIYSASPEALNQNFIDLIPSKAIIIVTVLTTILTAVQMNMLLKKGQTLGKYALQIKIVDIETYELPSVKNLLIFRTIVPHILSIIFPIFLIIDGAYIFKQDQCLHDIWGNTIVVNENEA